MGSGWGGGGAEAVAAARAREAAKGQGDMGVGVHPPMSVSQTITAKSIERSAGRALADAAERYIRNGTTGNRELLEQAVQNYRDSVVVY